MAFKNVFPGADVLAGFLEFKDHAILVGHDVVVRFVGYRDKLNSRWGGRFCW